MASPRYLPQGGELDVGGDRRAGVAVASIEEGEEDVGRRRLVVAALELALPEDEFEKVLDLDMEESDLSDFFETLSEALVGGAKN